MACFFRVAPSSGGRGCGLDADPAVDHLGPVDLDRLDRRKRGRLAVLDAELARVPRALDLVALDEAVASDASPWVQVSSVT
jgi:hypothetical protein